MKEFGKNKHWGVLILSIVLSLNMAIVSVGAATLVKPGDTATQQNVLDVVAAYNQDVYYILTEQLKQNDDFMTWYRSDYSVIEGLDTATHETYHGYTHNEHRYYREKIYAGSGMVYRLDFNNASKQMFATSEMAKNLPNELRTFRYDTYVSESANASANVMGVYGLINEFTAYYWGLNVMTSMIPYLQTYDAGYDEWSDYASSLANNMTAYSEFKYWMLEYMIYAKEQHPDLYNSIMENEEFCKAYSDMEMKFASLIQANIDGLDGINAVLSSQGKGISIEIADNKVRCKMQNGWRGSGIEDYSLLMAELEKQPCVDMDAAIKKAAGFNTEKFTGIRLAEDGAYYLYVDDEIQTAYTGLYNDAVYGWWYVENGSINFGYNGVVLHNDAWWCVAGGRVAFEYTGLWYDANVGWWYVENGSINFGYNGLVLYNDVWWCVAGGRVAFEYTGLWYDANVGWWYVENGSINFDYNGLVPYNDAWWCVVGGRVAFEYTGLWYDTNVGWWYVANGSIHFGYTGIATNEYGAWQVNNGMVVF